MEDPRITGELNRLWRERNVARSRFARLASLVAKGQAWTPARWEEELRAAGFSDLADANEVTR